MEVGIEAKQAATLLHASPIARTTNDRGRKEAVLENCVKRLAGITCRGRKG